MISLNLLPDVKKDLLRVRRERNMAVSISILAIGISVGALVILGGTLGTLAIIKATTEGGIKKNQAIIDKAKGDKDSGGKELDKYLTIQNQLSQLDGLKSKQEIYSRLLDYLTALNPAAPNNVSLRTASLAASGNNVSGATTTGITESGVTLVLEGRANNFAAVGVYKDTLQNAKLNYEDKPEDGSADSSDSASSTSAADSNNGSDSVSGNSDSKQDKTKTVPLFKQVVVQSSALSTSGNSSSVNFSIAMVIDDNAFSAKVINPTVSVAEQKTSDGVRSAPTETFHTDPESTDGGNQ